MGGSGVEHRMASLRQSAEQQILKPLQTHGWDASISSSSSDGEYLVVTAAKGGTTKRVALMYSSATSNSHYKHLDSQVDHIFTNGALYKLESYAYGISTPVETVDEFFPLLVNWNKELAPATVARPFARRPEVARRLTAEFPLESVWTRLEQFGSVQLAERLVRRRATTEKIDLADETVRSKASGVAHAIRNASDYFRNPGTESLNKRVLSLYYGALALAFAELLASPSGPTDLDEVEGMTKQGHGLFTLQSPSGDFATLQVGTLATGFFPRWLSFLGYDTSSFPKAKPKGPSDFEKLDAGTHTTLTRLLSAVPELEDLFLEVFDSAPAWVVPAFDDAGNARGHTRRLPSGSTYVTLIDTSGRMSSEDISRSGWPIAELNRLQNSGKGNSFRVRVDHANHEFWHQALPIHHSPFVSRSALILPFLGPATEYRVLAMTILYALSILVRYMPSTWRRVEGGDTDQYLALVRASLGVFERLLPEEFLSSIAGEYVRTRQPGSMF